MTEARLDRLTADLGGKGPAPEATGLASYDRGVEGRPMAPVWLERLRRGRTAMRTRAQWGPAHVGLTVTSSMRFLTSGPR